MMLNTYRGFTKNTEAQYAPLDKECGEDDGIELAPLDRHSHTWTTKQVIKVFTVIHLILFSTAAGCWFLWREQPINKSLKDISFYCKYVCHTMLCTSLTFPIVQLRS